MTEGQGQLRAEGERRGIRFERRYDVPPADVWSALTDPERLARWLAGAELDLRVGGQYVLRFSGEDESQITRGRVLALEPERLLELSWLYPGEADTVVRFELRPDGDGTILVLDHANLPAEEAPGYGGGWHAHLDALDAHLGREEIPDWWGRYGELAPLYEQQDLELQTAQG
jgi:uncharacterized protein YndB with AHSA1/START domain